MGIDVTTIVVSLITTVIGFAVSDLLYLKPKRRELAAKAAVIEADSREKDTASDVTLSKQAMEMLRQITSEFGDCKGDLEKLRDEVLTIKLEMTTLQAKAHMYQAQRTAALALADRFRNEAMILQVQLEDMGETPRCDVRSSGCPEDILLSMGVEL